MNDPRTQKTYLIIGATRGIGLEFTRQLLLADQYVIATQRSSSSPSSNLKKLADDNQQGKLSVLNCDVSDEKSIEEFVEEVGGLIESGWIGKNGKEGNIVDTVIFNAGILEYPGRVSEFSRKVFSRHIQINTFGPLQAASLLLAHPSLSFHNLVFISSDSGSASQFLGHEDGFAAYSMSKAALNQGLRHLSYEIASKWRSNNEENGKSLDVRMNSDDYEPVKYPVVLAIHPGEVMTDMASNVNVPWEVPGQIEAKESVEAMLGTIGEVGWGGKNERGHATGVDEKERKETGATFWNWDGTRHGW